MKIAISGSNGFIGSKLFNYFKEAGHQVFRIVRLKPFGYHNSIQSIYYNFEKRTGDWERLEGFDMVIHLAGASITAQPWSSAYKKIILDSRANSTYSLSLDLARLSLPPRLFITASATGYYGISSVRVHEGSPRGEQFLSKVCEAWELATSPAQERGIRTVHLRLGMVLGKNGGVLSRMIPLFRSGLGASVGRGDQPVNWVSLEEIPEIISFIMDHPSIQGPVNCVSPQTVSNSSFTKALAKQLKSWSGLRIPAFFVKLFLGQQGEELFLGGASVEPRKLTYEGYCFLYPQLDRALEAAIQ
jgi:uncharacterized protein (TIGR01777 family)